MRLAQNFYEHDSRFNSRKVSFDEWWNRAKDSVSSEVVEPTYSYTVPKIIGTTSDSPSVGDSWKPTQALPEGDTAFSFVWTGRK
jgi:hypothetical protein